MRSTFRYHLFIHTMNPAEHLLYVVWELWDVKVIKGGVCNLYNHLGGRGRQLHKGKATALTCEAIFPTVTAQELEPGTCLQSSTLTFGEGWVQIWYKSQRTGLQRTHVSNPLASMWADNKDWLTGLALPLRTGFWDNIS